MLPPFFLPWPRSVPLNLFHSGIVTAPALLRGKNGKGLRLSRI